MKVKTISTEGEAELEMVKNRRYTCPYHSNYHVLNSYNALEITPDVLCVK